MGVLHTYIKSSSLKTLKLRVVDSGHFLIAEFRCIAPVCGANVWTIGVLQANKAVAGQQAAQTNSAVADDWSPLVEEIARMTVRVIVGDLQRANDPLVHALSRIVKTTIMFGRWQDLNPFCVLGGVRKQKTRCRSYDPIPDDTTNLRFPNFIGIPRVRVKKPRDYFPEHHKLIIALEGQQSNRSVQAKIKRQETTKQRQRKAQKNRGSGGVGQRDMHRGSGEAPVDHSEL